LTLRERRNPLRSRVGSAVNEMRPLSIKRRRIPYIADQKRHAWKRNPSVVLLPCTRRA
jgi:hypothetical protein